MTIEIIWYQYARKSFRYLLVCFIASDSVSPRVNGVSAASGEHIGFRCHAHSSSVLPSLAGVSVLVLTNLVTAKVSRI